MYLVVSLLDMCSWGGTTASAVKKAIDSIFKADVDGSRIPLPGYRTKLISVTAEFLGANLVSSPCWMTTIAVGYYAFIVQTTRLS